MRERELSLNSFELPILIAFYTRSENVRNLINTIRPFKPAKIYISSDGPKTEEETIRVDQSRAEVSKIDWDAEIIKIYHDKNLGMYEAFAVALDQILSREPGVVVLEDDCVPLPGFFEYFTEMDSLYSSVDHIAAYCGFNAIGATPFFSNRHLTHTLSRRFRYWGHYLKADFWIEFRHARQNIPLSRLTCIREGLRVPGLLSKAILVRTLLNHRLELGPGDILMDIFLKDSRKFVTVPSQSVVKNIGDGEDATHTKSLPDLKLRSWRNPSGALASGLNGRYTPRVEVIEGWILVMWKIRQLLFGHTKPRSRLSDE